MASGLDLIALASQWPFGTIREKITEFLRMEGLPRRLNHTLALSQRWRTRE
jgi:hypothetical protein